MNNISSRRCSWRRTCMLCLRLLTLCLFVKRNIAFCPSKCRCEEDNNLRIECPNAALDVVPIQLNPDVRFINLTLNHIQNVHFTLQFYYNLEVLDLSQNHIGTLGSKNFESQEKLIALNLSRNLITHLNKDVFRGLRSLQTLVLNENRIGTIHPSAMFDLVNLRSMALANNSVMSLENDTLKRCSSLQSIDLRQNELLDVPIENLRYLSQTLRTLDLSQNFIEALENTSFAALSALRRLDISGNVLNSIDTSAFAPLKELIHLNLADNNITNVPSDQLSHLTHLQYLSISGNNIRTLPALAFVNLFQLKELYMDRMNHLDSIDDRAFVDNTLLQTLSMDDNGAITTMPPNLYRNNPKLIDIRVRRNSLQQLDATHFPLVQLHRLAVAQNPLVCNCSLLWLWHLTQKPTAEERARFESDHNVRMPRSSSFVLVDKENVTCDFWSERSKLRTAPLYALSAGDIDCPAFVAYLIAAAAGAATIAVVAVIVGVIVVRHRRQRARQRCARERKHIMDRMAAASAAQNATKLKFEYQAGGQGHHTEVTLEGRDDEEDDDDDDEDLDHYEQFDDFRYDHRRHVKQPSLLRLQQPSIVYV